MQIGISSAEIKLVKEFLANQNDNQDYQQALDVFAGLLIELLAQNMERMLEEKTND